MKPVDHYVQYRRPELSVFFLHTCICDIAHQGCGQGSLELLLLELSWNLEKSLSSKAHPLSEVQHEGYLGTHIPGQPDGRRNYNPQQEQIPYEQEKKLRIRGLLLKDLTNPRGAGVDILADQLTLYQPGRHIILTQYYKLPRIFRPCDGPVSTTINRNLILILS